MEKPTNAQEMLASYIRRAAAIDLQNREIKADKRELTKEIRGAGFSPRSIWRAVKIENSENPTMTAEEHRTEIAEDLQAIDTVAPAEREAAE